MAGQQILEYTSEKNISNWNESFSINGEGVYFLRAVIGDRIITKKIFIVD